MRTAVAETSIQCYHESIQPSSEHAQCGKILSHIEMRGGDWSIGEIARALDMEKSTVSARIHHMLYETKELEARPHRKDRVSNITVRPVGLPTIQRELFQ